jgi:hypothetical protein
MIIIIFILSLIVVVPAFAWEGYDYERGTYVEIEKGNLVRPGQEIEYYDFDKGEYRYGDVESIKRSGSSVEVEVYDSDSGDYRNFEMDE